MPVFYNTNNEEGAILERSKKQAERQEKKVLAFFKDNPGKYFSREEINDLVLPESPYTSAQRAITNLTNEGLLVKTDSMVMGKWGKMVHTWKLKEGVNFYAWEGNQKASQKSLW